LFLLN
jgi:hypothetical protein